MCSKFIKSALVAIFALTVFTFQVNTAEAASKVMWGKTELKIGQIGKVTVLASTNLVKLNANGSLTTVRTLKKGEEYRVYSYKSNNGGLYGVGGGSYVQQTTKVKYETPSKSKLALLNAVTSGLSPKEGLKLTYYPNFIDDTTQSFIVTKSSLDSTTYSKLTSVNDGYEYMFAENSSGISFGMDESDFIFFDLTYPFIEGKETINSYFTEDWEEAIEYINVESTTSTVTVKAGTFKNVVIIRYSNGLRDYLAPGFGIIKTVDSDGETITELISFQ
ncbi:hypothetical protein OR571_13110 [Psychrobacillus sp. NEAU-3TGS]|uniref:hypothetical protein n=1 Tax=Psychrobacillus sp. NEAU-3TGS TaxID=2995412 RepID=UPI00249845A3|nr:hypothetical protein [Psychrobacillus sp. NEAU-3TGS]MDI2588027.1 hypothetical protein [Psychrobacillus sp. NEAU-3TGS]